MSLDGNFNRWTNMYRSSETPGFGSADLIVVVIHMIWFNVALTGVLTLEGYQLVYRCLNCYFATCHLQVSIIFLL